MMCISGEKKTIHKAKSNGKTNTVTRMALNRAHTSANAADLLNKRQVKHTHRWAPPNRNSNRTLNPTLT